MFREESEGYSKLIVELNQEVTEDYRWETLLEIIQSLIGMFNAYLFYIYKQAGVRAFIIYYINNFFFCL